MPRGKKMQTPSKEPESSSMTHEEEEEMLHDISKLQEQVQQISISKRVTKNEMEAKMDGLKKGMEAKMDSLKKSMEPKIDDVEDNMEYLKKKHGRFEGRFDKVDRRNDS